MGNENEDVKTATEIGMMAGQLSTKHQFYVLNTINALLFSKQVNGTEQHENTKREKTPSPKRGGNKDK